MRASSVNRVEIAGFSVLHTLAEIAKLREGDEHSVRIEKGVEALLRRLENRLVQAPGNLHSIWAAAGAVLVVLGVALVVVWPHALPKRSVLVR